MTDQELNDLAAERVMGWERVTSEYSATAWWSSGHGLSEVTCSYSSWEPVTSLNAAFLLLKKLDVQFTISGCGEVDLYHGDGEYISVLTVGKEPADFARAITRACLQAQGVPDVQ